MKRAPNPEKRLIHIDAQAHKDAKSNEKSVIRVHRPKNGKQTGTIKVGRTVMQLFTGEIDVTEWTMEELFRGAPMNIKVPPNVIPVHVYNELVRRVTMIARAEFSAHLEYSVEKHMAVIRGIQTMENNKGETIAIDVTPVQLRAIELLYDRVMGKAPESIEMNVQVNAPWQQLMAKGIVADAEQLKEKTDKDEEEVVEGEIVEDEES